jgi:hypothetical protein
MAQLLAFAQPLQRARADAITTFAGASCKLRVYDGTRPATGGTATTLLAELTCNATFAPGSAGAGVLTLNAITQDASADATGTATWFRMTKSDGTTHIMDGNVSTASADWNLNSVSIVATGTVSCTSFVLTEGNA